MKRLPSYREMIADASLSSARKSCAPGCGRLATSDLRRLSSVTIAMIKMERQRDLTRLKCIHDGLSCKQIP